MGTTSIKDGVADIQATVAAVSGGNALLVQAIGGSGISTNVNIFDSSGNSLNSVSGSLDVYDATTGTIGSTLGSLALTVGLKNASGNLEPLTGDSSNNLNVNIAAGSVSVTQASLPWIDNVSQFGGNAVVTGTGASGNGIPRITVSNDSNILATQSGSWTVGQGSKASVSGAWPITLTDGTSITAAFTGTSLNVNITNTTPISGTVTANQGTAAATASAWPIKLTDGTQTNTLKTLGTQVVSTDIGLVTNSVIHGLSTAGGGAYVDVKVTPSGSITTADNADGTPGSAIPGSAIMIGLKNPSANLAAAICDTSSNLYVNIAASSVTIPVSGTVTANQGTSPWVSNITQFGSSNVVTGTGVSGVGIPRVTVSNDSNVLATQSGTWTVQQGATPTAVANAWPIKVTDTTNTAAVKAASTAPIATDPALVVTVSPNSPAPTTKGTAIGNAPVFLSFTSTNVTTSAYVQLVASTTSAINQIFISDTSGQVMIFAVGAAASEVNQFIVPQGGQGVWSSLNIPAGSRLSYKAQTGTASSGYLVMGFLQ